MAVSPTQAAGDRSSHAAALEPADRVPRSTKQDVLDRGWQVWKEFDHASGVDLHKRLGYTTALDGSEDHV